MFRLPAFAAILLVLTAASGCAAPSGGDSTGELDPGNPFATEPTHPGRSRTAQVRAQVLPVGTVPFDNLALPLVSPDGRFVATQTGLPPTWDTVIAGPSASVPQTTRIEIYEIFTERGVRPRLVATVDDPVLLGRAVLPEGFLVEAPRGDGARWIGLARWTTGDIEWLVDDDAVSAFATVGPGGRLAFSQRERETARFDLVVRSGAEEWRLSGQDGSWLMPTWSGLDPGLFALRLRDGALEAAAMSGASEDAMRRTIRLTPLAAEGATLTTAYQTLGATSVLAVPAGAPSDHLELFHPSRLRPAIWRPPADPIVLDTKSITAVLDRNDPWYVLLVTETDLVRRSLVESLDRINLIAGVHVPRPTASPERPWVLLQPMDGSIGVTLMVMLE